MVEFDKNDNPILSIGEGKMVAFVTEDSQQYTVSNKKIDYVNIGKFNIVPNGDGNDFPQKAHETINNTAVLKRAISDLARVTLGQGIYPCEVIDTFDDGREKVQIIKDENITNNLQSYIIRRYLAKTCYNLLSYGNSYVQLIPNKEGTKILKLNPISSLHGRLEKPDKQGFVKNLLVSGLWPNVAEADIKSYPLLDEIDPFGHLKEMKANGILKKSTVFMHIQNSFDSNDFYAMPNWYAAMLWITITNKVPKIINAGMDNVLNIFFVVKIPKSYWDWKYPEDMFEDKKARRAKIEADIKLLEDKFTSVENAKKALITHFGHDEAGTNDDKWEIEIKQPTFNQENFVTSSAADTQIAIAAGYSPDLLGLMYGNSKGGSMQRELLLLQYALSWELRQQLADPIEMMLKFNYPNMTNLVLRFRNTFLTTLDSGAGTGKTLS